MSDRTILVTGAAGFIGFHIARRLLSEGRDVVGLDNLNAYYDPKLKQARLELLRADPRFTFVQADLADRATVAALFAKHRFDVVVHLAAQAGVRYSSSSPMPMSTPTCKASAMCWKDAGTINASICCTRRRPRSMAPTPRCRLRSATTPIIPSASMPRPRRPTR
jgi:NAD(P)-dependent dehydrogenase (short-subunit alcohol dehydrogenase family)